MRVSAPYAALAFIVGTSHHDGAKTLLARVGATAAQFVVAAPSDAWIYEQTPLPFCFLGQSWYGQSPLVFLSHRTSDIAPARGSSPAYSRSPVCPSRCHGGRTLLGNGYSVVM